MSSLYLRILSPGIAVAFLLMTASCTRNSDSGLNDEESISYWTGWTGSDLEVQRKLVARFEALHPGKKVRLLSVAGAYQKVRIAFAGDDAPDVCSALWPEDLADYAAHGYLEALDSRMAGSNRELSEWYPAAASIMKAGSKVYGISLTCNPFFILYNKDLSRKAGYGDDLKPGSIEDFTQVVEKLTHSDKSGRIVQLGILTPNLVEWAPLFGGAFYDSENHRVTASNPGNVRALEWISGLVKKPGARRVLDFEQGGGNMQSAVNPFYTGQVGMFVSSIWEEHFINRYAPDLNYGYFPMPSEAGQRPDAAYVSGSIFVISASSRKKELAWEFLNWLSSPEAAAEFCKGIKNIPSIRKAAEDDAFSSPMFRFARTLLENPESYTAPQMPFWTAYKSELVRAQESVIHGEDSPKDALLRAEQRIQVQLDELLHMFELEGMESAI